MSVDRAREETSSTQFIKWVEFYRRKAKERKREFYYLAAVRFQVYLLYLSMTGQTQVDKTIEDFMLEFTDSDRPAGIGQGFETEEQYEEAWKTARDNLFAHLGVVPNDTGTGIMHVPKDVKVEGFAKTKPQGNTPPFTPKTKSPSRVIKNSGPGKK